MYEVFAQFDPISITQIAIMDKEQYEADKKDCQDDSHYSFSKPKPFSGTIGRPYMSLSAWCVQSVKTKYFKENYLLIIMDYYK